MCGIAGSVNFALEPGQVLKALNHRGPEGRGQFEQAAVQLLHTRLAILDELGGAQPMRRGNLVACYNGEIYNHQELRTQHGLSCHSHSDTETLLALYEKLGPDCLPELDGMFAFAIYDIAAHRLFLARDRMGEKPLYLWQQNQQIVFASELNALAECLPLEVNEDAVNQFLGSGIFIHHATPFSGVTELRPGHSVTINCADSTCSYNRWFSIEQHYLASRGKQISSLPEAIDELDSRLNRSVANTLGSSDREVGCFLSGGIDSGLVTALASQHTDNLRTFTVSFAGQFDESPLAEAVAKRYQTRHETLHIDFNSLEQDIEAIVLNYGEPIADDSIIPTWYVCQAAKEHVSVVLTGDGADEQFAGYRRYVPYASLPLFTSGETGFPLMSTLARMLPYAKKEGGLYQHLSRLVSLLGESGINRYLMATTMANRMPRQQHSLAPELLQQYNSLAQLPLTHLQRLMLMDAQVLLPAALLPKMDIGSMAHALETRSPFLSKHIVEFAPCLHDSLKVNKRTTKYLLRELAKRYLPSDVVQAPKRGFGTPLTQWLQTHLKAPVHDRLQPAIARVRDYCVPGAVDALLAGKAQMPASQQARMLWMLYTTELWLQSQSNSGSASSIDS